MTSLDHNKTIGLAHGLIGVLALTGLIVAAVLEIRKSLFSDLITNFPSALYFLPIPFLQILTAYGLFRRKPWARILVLLFSVLYVWIFPLGTLLAIYTWWFMNSANGKQLYAKTKI
jgi:hypothetical protein